TPAGVEPPLKWHGGKHYLAKHVLSMMPPHLHYVEPYFGGGQVLFLVLQDEQLYAQMRHRLELTLASEAEWNEAGRLLRAGEGTPVERAAALFVSVRLSRQALRKDFVSPVRTRLRGGRQDHVNGWWSAIEGLEDAHRRLQNVLVLDGRPTLEVIRSEDTEA